MNHTHVLITLLYLLKSQLLYYIKYIYKYVVPIGMIREFYSNELSFSSCRFQLLQLSISHNLLFIII